MDDHGGALSPLISTEFELQDRQGLKFSVLGTDFSLEDSNHSIHALTIEK